MMAPTQLAPSLPHTTRLRRKWPPLAIPHSLIHPPANGDSLHNTPTPPSLHRSDLDLPPFKRHHSDSNTHSLCYSRPFKQIEESADSAVTSNRVAHIDLKSLGERRGVSDAGRIDISAADEMMVREIMQSLEQAIGKTIDIEDSSSSSSSPVSNRSHGGRGDVDHREQTSDTSSMNTAAAQDALEIVDKESSASIDEELRQLLRQAVEESALNVYGGPEEYSTTDIGADFYGFLDMDNGGAVEGLALDHTYDMQEPFDCF